MLIGDFNAHVASRDVYGEQWDKVRGPNGYEAINDAGKELLLFLSIHQATVCNTWFQKKAIHKATWQHPKSKQWSCIDYFIMRQSDRKVCLNVSVLRGAECNADHHFLCATLRLNKHYHHVGKKKRKGGRYDVVNLLKGDGNIRGDQQLLKDVYIDTVVDKARDGWPQDGSVECKWEKFRSAITEVSDKLLGHSKRRQPDWFLESSDVLKPYLMARNDAYRMWLSSSRREDLMKFKQARSTARRVARKAKNEWFQLKAEQIERQCFGGKDVWKNIRDLQLGRRGRYPIRVITVNDEDGNLCVTRGEQQDRWRRHFTSVLNIRSHFDESVLLKCIKSFWCTASSCFQRSQPFHHYKESRMLDTFEKTPEAARCFPSSLDRTYHFRGCS